MDNVQPEKKLTLQFLIKPIIIISTLIIIGIVTLLINNNKTNKHDIRSRADFSGSKLTLQPENINVHPGESVSFNILVNSPDDKITAVDLQITYDPSIVEVKNFIVGSVMPVVLVPASFNNGRLTVTLGVEPSNPFTGSGVLGTLMVSVLQNKSSIISFNSSTIITAVNKNTNTVVSATGSRLISTEITTNQVKPTSPSLGQSSNQIKPTITITTKPTTTKTPTITPAIKINNSQSAITIVTPTIAPTTTTNELDETQDVIDDQVDDSSLQGDSNEDFTNRIEPTLIIKKDIGKNPSSTKQQNIFQAFISLVLGLFGIK